jgi:hypothetical protein
MAGRTSIFSLFDWQKKPYSSAYGRDSGTYCPYSCCYSWVFGHVVFICAVYCLQRVEG